MLSTPLKWLIGGLFTAAMLALVVGLAFFLREVHLAMQSVRIPTLRTGDAAARQMTRHAEGETHG